MKIKIDVVNPSIMTNDMHHCYLCGKGGRIEWHHIMSNSNRDKSAKYKLIVPLCPECHRTGKHAVHTDYAVCEKLRKEAQIAFEREYPNESWIKIFKRNYK